MLYIYISRAKRSREAGVAMKINYAELKHRSRILQSLTDLNTSEFEALLHYKLQYTQPH